jgi:uncharacterized protein (TIGR03435 family)
MPIDICITTAEAGCRTHQGFRDVNKRECAQAGELQYRDDHCLRGLRGQEAAAKNQHGAPIRGYPPVVKALRLDPVTGRVVLSVRSGTKLFLAGAVLAVASSQSQPPGRAEFDFASIKPNHANRPLSFGANNGQAGGQNVTLRTLIALAYRVQEFQVSGGPQWVGSDRFDVEGKTQDLKADPDRLRLMLQSLLEDRFKLKLHRETKVASVYALVMEQGDSKMQRSADQSNEEVNGPSPAGAGPNHGAIRIGMGRMIGNAATMPLFARMLSQRLDRLVVDSTGLSGRFDIQLHWTPGAGEVPYGPGGNALPATDPHGPSIFSAVQEQLGLKLESATALVEFLDVDSVEKPSEN